MRIATIASVAVLGLSSAALATTVTGTPLQTMNNTMADNMMNDNMVMSNDMQMSNDDLMANDTMVDNGTTPPPR